MAEKCYIQIDFLEYIGLAIQVYAYGVFKESEKM